MFSHFRQNLFPSYSPETQKQLLFLMLILIFLIAILAITVPWKYTVGILSVILIFLFFLKFINLGIYLIALLYPFIYLQLWIGRDINVPYVDLLAMFVFAAWVVRSIFLPPYGGLTLIRKWTKGEAKISFENFPGILFFLLFILASCLSLINAENLFYSVKYILRPLTFFYLMFVIVPYNVINSKKVLFRVFWILYFLGIFVALMGFWSILTSEAPGLLRRAIPLPIFGIPILGTNHNLIAEVLISIIPIGFILVWETKELFFKKLLIVGILLMIVINLLTFSRTGWIALVLELGLLMLIKYRKSIKSIAELGVFLALIISPLLIYMYLFMTSEIVRTSNLNRIALTKIAIETFKKHPIVGAGAGTFVEQVARERWYIVDFGEPSEAHGVVQKLIAETGVLGLVTFFLLLGYVMRRLIRTYWSLKVTSPWKYVLLALILSSSGSIVFQLFNTSYFVSKLWFPLGIALAASRLAEEEDKS
jgi:O-antigen ligase